MTGLGRSAARRRGRARVATVAAAAASLALVGGWTSMAPAGAAPRPATYSHPVVAVGANQSNNWSGYNQGTTEKGGKTFHSITGDWVVPRATAHKPMESEYSATWVGIGGGCLDSACNQTDNTLIQAGTEQDVNYDPIAGTSSSYSAWYELIPNSQTTVSLTVHAGDHVHVDIHEITLNSENWSITVQNLTTGQSWSTTTPYQSTYATAEWIEETPTVVAVSIPPTVGFAPLPNLGSVNFDLATVNGAPAGLQSAEQVQLVDLVGTVEATPSSPDPDTDGFNDCSYATSCTAPATS